MRSLIRCWTTLVRSAGVSLWWCNVDILAVPSTVTDAIEAGNIAHALTVSFRTGKPVLFDEQNQPILA